MPNPKLRKKKFHSRVIKPAPNLAKRWEVGTWQDTFRAYSMRIGFQLSLSKAMLEMLCAVADDVQWDRRLYHQGSHCPENWIASTCSLVKRGLICRKDQEWLDNHKHDPHPQGEWCCYQLTPAGQCVVDLVKLAGIYVEADAAINKKARRA